jgi:hypothetical protein
MHRLLRILMFAVLVVPASAAQATFHVMRIDQLYSNADGSVQYMELLGLADFQNLLAGHTVLTMGGPGGNTLFVFPTNLPGNATNGKHILIATQGFAALNLVTPDYIVPNGFFPIANGKVSYGEGVDLWSYASLPTDGVTALFANGVTGPNVATNFAGASASVGPAAPAPNYQGLWWKPDEAGWGINFVHQGDQIFATWYTYDTAGNAYWLTMLASRTAPGGNAYHGDVFASIGPPFNNFAGAAPASKVGDGTITFSDANNGTFAYNLNMGTGGATTAISQAKAITRFVLDGSTPQPACAYAASPNLAAAVNYQDLWWVPSESGWGINFAHQGNIIYATWYTFDAKVAGNTNAPLWLSALVSRQGASNVFTGSLLRSAGPRFDNFKTSDLVQPATTVGTVTLTFADGNNATFRYTTTGAGSLPVADQTKSITRFLFAAPAGTTCQ